MPRERPGQPGLLVDPRWLRARCLALLTHATDRYLRSTFFLTSMRLGLRAFSGARSSRTGIANEERQQNSARRP